jgi:hypothetical protein
MSRHLFIELVEIVRPYIEKNEKKMNTFSALYKILIQLQ